MSYVNPIWLEGQRRRWLKPDWQRWVRHDAHRFMPPDPNSYRSYASRLVERRRAEEKQAAHEAEVKQFYGDHLALRRELADLKFELAWRGLCRKYGCNPNQPRVPAGSPDGGQWADGASAVGDAVAFGQLPNQRAQSPARCDVVARAPAGTFWTRRLVW